MLYCCSLQKELMIASIFMVLDTTVCFLCIWAHLVFTKTLWGTLIFYLLLQTLSILPYLLCALRDWPLVLHILLSGSCLCLVNFALWFLLVFGQWEFPGWDQKVEAKWGHGIYFLSSLPFGSLWVGCLPFSKTITPLYLVFNSLSLGPGNSLLFFSIGLEIVKSLCCC